MASKQSTVDFITEQMAAAGHIRCQKMFGEYGVYCDDKIVALVCDDQLYVKPTVAGKKFLGDVHEVPPYPGAKMYYLIDPDRFDDREWLSELIRLTASELPLPKPKKKK